LKRAGVGFGAYRPVVGNSEILLPVAIESPTGGEQTASAT
jgi:hypothetical protein